MSRPIRIALSTDVRGLAPNATLLASVLRRTQASVEVRCWCRGFLPDSFESGPLKVEFLSADEPVSGRYPGHVNEAVFDRLRVIKDCPDWDRCLILDHDMVVLRDLAEYFAEDFEDMLLMGRLFGPGNTLGLQMRQRGGLPPTWKHAEDHPYFYMGPMMNLDGMREVGTWETFLEAHEAIGQDEQLSLTAACGGRVKGVSKHWNLVPQWDGLMEEGPMESECAKQDGVERVDAAGIPWRNGVPAGVIHWTGWDKPWNRQTKVWRPDLWHAEKASWEHLRLGIWEKPEVVELDSEDEHSANALARRGCKVKVSLSPGWEAPSIERFPDMTVERAPTLSAAQEVRLGLWADPEWWLRQAKHLPETLVLKGEWDGVELNWIREWGYDGENRIRASAWPAGGPVAGALDYQGAREGEDLEADQWLYLRRDSAAIINGDRQPGERPQRKAAKGSERVAVIVAPRGRTLSQAWYESVRRNFLPGCDVGVFVLLDGRLVRVPQDGFQGNHGSRQGEDDELSLEVLARAAGDLGEWEHVFWLSASVRVMGKVGVEVLGRGLVAVSHPGYHEAEPNALPYERRPASAAHVPSGLGNGYFTGVVKGGSREAFLQALDRMAAMQSADHLAGLRAVWDAESYWNRHLVDRPPSVVLGPGYGRPQYQAEEFPLKIAVVPEKVPC